MHTHITPLYKRISFTVPLHIRFLLSALVLLAPYHSLGSSGEEPYTQEFLITAYYSPKPDQCCYVKGGYVADKILNGEGHTAADGTAVYPGMLAAPKGYAFGTKITLPMLGTLTVHDRGGAITTLENGMHRLDIWVGEGEEGLARALAFGVQRMTGTVYPNGSVQPDTEFALASLPAPIAELEAYFVEQENFLALRPKEGESGLSVWLLQEKLQELGYLHRLPTGFFGEETKAAVEQFLKDFGVDASASALSETSAAFIMAAVRRRDAGEPLSAYVDHGASPQAVSDAQRMLRFLGYYRGRTDGIYDDEVREAIFQFQKDHALVGDWDSQGAGRIGPLTAQAIANAHNRRLVAEKASRYLDVHRIDMALEESGQKIQSYLDEGYTGKQVELLQRELAALGFFPEEEVNGVYGPLTKESVFAYQKDRGIVRSANDTGAGRVGPSTLYSLQKDQRSIVYKAVRAEGWRMVGI